MRSRSRLVLLALLALPGLAACGSTTPKPPPPPLSSHAPEDVKPPAQAPVGAHELLASLTRTMCFGWCPAYTVRVYRDGTLEYEGEEYVKTKGAAKGHVDARQLADLDALFATAKYLTLKDEYTEYEVTDNPSANTQYRPVGGPTKSIAHYYGDSHAPEALSDVESGIDRIVHIEQFIGTEQERQALGRGGAD